MFGPRTQASRHAATRTAGAGIAFTWLAAALLLAASLVASQAARGAEEEAVGCNGLPHGVTVVVSGVRSSKGVITADLHGDRPEDFLKKGKKLLRVRVPAQQGKTILCLKAPHAGLFAAGVYHDENANQRFDKNFLGMPKEFYGVSNNPTIVFRPPKLEEAAFTVGDKGTVIEIELRRLGGQ